MTEHKISTLKDIMDVVTPENYQNLIDDITLYVKMSMGLKSVGLTQDTYEITWKNDGVNTISFFRVPPTNEPKKYSMWCDSCGCNQSHTLSSSVMMEDVVYGTCEACGRKQIK